MSLRLLMSSLVSGLLFAAPASVYVEGYGEAYGFSHAAEGNEAVGRFIVAPSVRLSERVTLHTQLGFEHPSENGHWWEGELEVLSLDGSLGPDTLVSAGKIHVPVGLYNLNHEPIYFLTIEPSRVEHLIIPAEWHETALLVTHRREDLNVTVGVMSPMDGRKLARATWLREGKEGHLTDGGAAGWVARADYGAIDRLMIGGSVAAIPLSGTGADAALGEIHAVVRTDGGWEATAIASQGWIRGIEGVRAATGTTIAKSAKGAAMTVGYDVSPVVRANRRSVVVFGHLEYAQPSVPLADGGLGGSAWSTGIDWFVTPRIVAKGEFRVSNHEGVRTGLGIGFVY